MKKSEMVEMMYQFIMAGSTLNPSTSKSLATQLLKAMEEKGMNPPTISVLTDSYDRTNGTMGFESNEWENE